MNVLFVGKRFYTNRDAFVERFGRIYQLPFHWAAAGIATRLWLLDYHGGKQEQRTDGALTIRSTPLRGLAWLREWRESGRRHRFDTVIASGDCYIGLFAWRIARRARAKFVFDVYDKYDEFGAYRNLPGFDPFNFLLRRADACLFASRALMARVAADSGRNVRVPNGVDTSHFRPLNLTESRRTLGLPTEGLLIGYFGSMEPDRGVDDLIAAVERLRAEDLPIELVIAGKPRPGLKLHRPGIRFLGNLPYAQMPLALASCDLLALPYRHSRFMDMGASCKIAEYLFAQRPIVATRTPNLTANFPDQAAALGDLLASPGDSSDIARAIRAQLAARHVIAAPPHLTWSVIAADAAAALGDTANLSHS